MWYYRFFLPLSAVVGVFLLAGALRGPSWLRTPNESTLPNNVRAALDGTAEARATALFTQASQHLQNPQHTWLRTRVWMRVHVPDAQFEAEGEYVRAPGGRYRLEVRTCSLDQQKNGRGGKLLHVCDGQTHWQASQTEPERSGREPSYKEVKRLRLNQLPGTATPKSILRGPQALLGSLEHSHIWVHSEANDGNEIVTGVWSPTWRPLVAPTNQPWPDNLPRLYRITLAGATRWPARVETWGPLKVRGPDRLIAEMEFRDPVLNKPMPHAECEELFRFDPGQTPIEDETARYRAELTTP